MATASLKNTVKHFPDEWETSPEAVTITREPARAKIEERLLPAVTRLLNAEPMLAKMADVTKSTPPLPPSTPSSPPLLLLHGSIAPPHLLHVVPGWFGFACGT
jgi:hypothetical protein